MNNKLSVSLMCADLMHMADEVETLEANHVDWFHIDIMDAHFVPNLTFGPDYCKALKAISHTPLDYHLMMDNPELFINAVPLTAEDYVTVHSELPEDVAKSALRLVRSKGAHTGIAVNPDTPVERILPYLGDIDLVLLMLVQPGFAGQKMKEGIMDKVAATRAFLKEHGRNDVLISTDGNISVERAVHMAELGADIFVGGTSAVFKKGQRLEDTICAFFKAVNG